MNSVICEDVGIATTSCFSSRPTDRTNRLASPCCWFSTVLADGLTFSLLQERAVDILIRMALAVQ
jgi:hypothetical protein